jgi:tRNA(fMet)-specific endonuclease VapC
MASKSKKIVLCDSNVIIDLLNGDADARDQLREIGTPNIAISVITLSEVLYGARSKVEFVQIRQLLEQFNILPLDDDVSRIFYGLIVNYTMSHRAGIPDALIAATAISHGHKLFTSNYKHFRHIPEISFYQPKK